MENRATAPSDVWGVRTHDPGRRHLIGLIRSPRWQHFLQPQRRAKRPAGILREGDCSIDFVFFLPLIRALLSKAIFSAGLSIAEPCRYQPDLETGLGDIGQSLQLSATGGAVG
jgi:hypothetical protein